MRNTSVLQRCCVLCFSILMTLYPIAATALDTITATQPLTVGQTLISAGEVFEMGFFSPNNSSNNLYLGIWYKQLPEQTVVWVGNRGNPVTNSSAVVKISGNGNVVLVEGANSTPLWSSNQTSSNNTVAQLLDSGNFVLRSVNDSDPMNFLWQSFDYPTDTLLPGMKLGWDSKTGLNRYLNSWKTSNDPSSGDYSFKLDINGFPEIYVRDKQAIQYRSGPWNGVRFSGVPEMNTSSVLNFSFQMNPNEVTYSFELLNKSEYSRLIMNSLGILQRYTWIDSIQAWNLFWYAPKDQCDLYRECGAYGVCDTDDSSVCQCLHGFVPQNPNTWALRDGSGGCVRVTELGCGGDGFLTLKGMKLPETETVVVDAGMSLVECEKFCLMNCSCTAYSSMDIRGGGSGCVIWIGDLMDMRQYSVDEGGQDLFVRVAASDSEAGSTGSRKKFEEISIIIGLAVSVGAVLLGLSPCFVRKRQGTQRALKEKIESKGSHGRSQAILLSGGITVSRRHYSSENPAEELEILLFDFGTIAIATNNFSEEKKLGEGGFGCVYKGTLVDGQEIAVKRLSVYSGQGTEEFKNEVRLIARVQHRNLVRLLGCCIEREEKMLIYEYMENKSLDSILFNTRKCSTLNWQKRFNIICGIARGLLYLHQDSRFRIIHRDLKASNILLDGEMNPKISDFGMARIFGGDQTEANTVRVVGTFGYMSPEYAMDGLFSVKSDVFSFGVLLLEIISGKKNRGFYNAQQELNLLGHAWWLWELGKGIELLDSSAVESCPPSEVMRCIQVALLCVQERAEDRPDMSSVVLMLSSNEAALISQPKPPAFTIGRKQLETNSSFTQQDESFTMNDLTVTILGGR